MTSKHPFWNPEGLGENRYHTGPDLAVSQGAAKGVRQNEFDHFSILVTSWSLFLTFLSLFSSLFCQTPFAVG